MSTNKRYFDSYTESVQPNHPIQQDKDKESEDIAEQVRLNNSTDGEVGKLKSDMDLMELKLWMDDWRKKNKSGGWWE